jgi:hypothetical protein
MLLFSPGLADVRINNDQPGVSMKISYRIPSTWGERRLELQKLENYDQFLRSNIDNEANKRFFQVEVGEQAFDMLPFRQNKSMNQSMVFQKGLTMYFPLRWNNPHDADCELNIWVDNMQNVIPIKRPFPCGGGYQDQRFPFQIPADLNGCNSKSDGCVLQFYAHSVETRTYAIGIDFYINSTAQGQGGPKESTDILRAVKQPAIHYNDAFDTAHTDSSYSGYRGQQYTYIRNHLKSVIKLRSYLGNGGLVGFNPIFVNRSRIVLKALETEVKIRILQEEAIAIEKNKAHQNSTTDGTCFEGSMYHVVNNPKCTRLYKTTYVTNVDYTAILNEFEPKLIKAGFASYMPKLKNSSFASITPTDSIGDCIGPGIKGGHKAVICPTNGTRSFT